MKAQNTNFGENSFNRKSYDHSKLKNLSLMVDSTSMCQLKCSYCYFGEKDCKKMNTGALHESITNFVTAIGQQVKNLNVHYMGGEPLLAWSEIQELNKSLSSHFAEKKIYFSWSLTSNLVSLDKEKRDIMLAEKANIHCSIDGPQFIQDRNRPFVNGKGSFSNVDENIKYALEITPNDTARVTVTPFSAHYLPQITEYLIEKGFKSVGLFPAFNMDWRDEDITAWGEGIKISFELGKNSNKRISTIIRPYVNNNKSFTYCGAGKGLWAFDVDGNLYSCHHFTNRKNQAIINASSTSVEALRSVIKSYSMAPISIDIPKECQDCSLKNSCNGGCWADNLLTTGSPFLPEAISCTFNKLTFESLKEFFINDPAPDITYEAYRCARHCQEDEGCSSRCERSCKSCDNDCQGTCEGFECTAREHSCWGN